MEGEGEGWTSAEDSDSEEERELEIALYSQIHFEAAPEHVGQQKYHFIDCGDVSFNVGVEEISLPLKSNAMEKVGSEWDFRDFLSHSQKHSKFRKNLEHADSADTIYITSSDDDASVEIISSDTIQDKPICNRNQTDSDECIFLEMSTAEINKRNHLLDEGNREASLDKRMPSSNCNKSLSTSANKTLDVTIPISNSPRDTISGQKTIEAVPNMCDQSQRNDIIKDDDVLILDEYIQLEESLLLNELNEKSHLVPQENTNQISPNEEEKAPGLDKKQLSSGICSESPHACPTTSEKPKESCYTLPFTITKAPVQIKKKSSSRESDESMENEPCSTKVQTNKKLTRNKRPLKMASDTREFLQFSENFKNFDKAVIKQKKKGLSKQEAAVKPRKPPVLLRKPPIVKVSYQQDSDTNTDYSDSDMSSISTPKKVPLNINKVRTGKSVREESRDSVETETSSSSSSSEIENEYPRSVSKKSYDLKSKSKLKKQKQQLKERKPSSCVDNDSEVETNEESDTASSVCSLTTDLDKATTHNPDLDFNIEGGVESLLKSQPGKTDREKWQINDQDRYQIPVAKSRYFNPLSLVCRNCSKEGHKALDCPEPRKSLCIFCGRMGHVYQACPDSICHNCNEPGHRLVDCKERPRGKRTICDRCWMPGHFTEDCPDLWRQYHLTPGPDHTKIQTASKKHFNPKVYCFNCGKEGHLGYECSAQLMNFHVIPNYPFIAKYNTGKSKENRIHRLKQKGEAKEKKNRYGQDFNRNKSHGKMEYKEEHWEEKVSRRKETGKSGHGLKRKGHSHHEENDKIYKSGGGKKQQKIYTDEGGKLHIEIPNEDRSHRNKKQIITEKTVFSFQNFSNEDYYREEDYRPPSKKRLSHETKGHKNNWYPHHNAKQPPHEYDMDEDDEFMNHQVFRNEWWNEGHQSTERRKRGQNKSSRQKAASKSKQKTTDNKFQNDEMYSDDEVHQYHTVKQRKQIETYDSSRKHISSHKSHQSASSSTGKKYGSDGYHKPYYKSGYQRQNKKKNKSGFQMNSHFQSLSKSCRRK